MKFLTKYRYLISVSLIVLCVAVLPIRGSVFNAIFDLIYIGAPVSFASGVRVYADATQKLLSDKNDAGTIHHTVATSGCSGGTPVVGNINADGSVTCAAGGGGGGGVSLAQLGVGISLADPTALSYTWFNQASSTITTNGATLRLFTPDSGGNNLSGRQTAITGSASYTFTVGFVWSMSGASFSQCGITVTDTTNYRLIRQRGESDLSMEVWSWNGTGSPGSSIGSVGGFGSASGFMRFLQIKEVIPGNRTYNYSADGVNYYTFATEASGTNIVPTQGGFFCLGNGQNAATVVNHVSLTTP